MLQLLFLLNCRIAEQKLTACCCLPACTACDGRGQ